MTRLRLGIVGTENSHANHTLHHLNVEDRYGGARVTALHGPDVDRNLALQREFDVADVVHDVGAMVGLVDAVVVMDRHGDAHLEHARPFLEAGMPTYVDKPLACATRDARELVALSAEHDAMLMSCSTLRYAPAVEDVAAALASVGEVRGVRMSGAGDPDSPYGGVFFYGIHCADVAFRFAPGPIGDVDARTRTGTTAISCTAGDTEISLLLVRSADGVSTPFHLTVVGSAGVLSRRISLGPDYTRGALDAFMRSVQTGRSPVAAEDMLRPIALLERAREQLS